MPFGSLLGNASIRIGAWNRAVATSICSANWDRRRSPSLTPLATQKSPKPSCVARSPSITVPHPFGHPNSKKSPGVGDVVCEPDIPGARPMASTPCMWKRPGKHFPQWRLSDGKTWFSRFSGMSFLHPTSPKHAAPYPPLMHMNALGQASSIMPCFLCQHWRLCGFRGCRF